MQDDIHAWLFELYLDALGTEDAKLITDLLPQSKSQQSGYYQFVVPDNLVNEFQKEVLVKNSILPEFRTRTTTSDRIVQPNLVSHRGSPHNRASVVKWPGESLDYSERTTVEDSYSEISIQLESISLEPVAVSEAPKQMIGGLTKKPSFSNLFLADMVAQYSALIDKSLFTSVYDEKAAFKSMTATSGVFDHISEGMSTVGGYIESKAESLEKSNMDHVKTALFHLPRGYRQRAKWYMSKATGKAIAKTKDELGNYLIDQRDEALEDVGYPDRLLGKPIVYNDSMADEGIVIILADLSRGYITSKRIVEPVLVVSKDGTQAHLKFRSGGQVLQPACFKGVRFVKDDEPVLYEG